MNLNYLSQLFIKLSSNKKYFVGTCTNSFDENGGCIINEPWNKVSDFAYAEQNSIEISKHEFLQNIDLSQQIIKLLLKKKNIVYTQYENIIFANDSIKDIHYFFI